MIFHWLFHSKERRVNLLTERLNAPKVHCLLQNDNQENLEWIFLKGGLIFQTDSDCSACELEIFRSRLSLIVEFESSDCWRAIRMISQY